jgi:hypothetical protein
MRFPHLRKMSWVLIVWSAIMFLWVIGGTASNRCASYADQASKTGCQAGTAIGWYGHRRWLDRLPLVPRVCRLVLDLVHDET